MITGGGIRTKRYADKNKTRVASYAKNFEPGRSSFLGPGDEEKLHGSLIRKPDGRWNSAAGIL